MGGTAKEAVVGSGDETGGAVVALHLRPEREFFKSMLLYNFEACTIALRSHLLESDEQRKDLRLGIE